MLNRDDLIDLIMGHLRELPVRAPSAGGPRGRLFLSEHEIKKRLTPAGTELKIPRGAIISPLAQDWLVLKGVKIVDRA
ncbi:MAG: hypothetical protein HY921_11115 [Elusimicrobia bacterium]|nr:hypothetical protein [Elusimicrobiota bacterium]